MENTYYVGEAIPSIRVDIGPVAMAAFLGAPTHFTKEPSWQEPIIENQNNLSWIKFDPSNIWFRKVIELAETTVFDATGHYTVYLPEISDGYFSKPSGA